MAPREFTILENNPEAVNALAHRLGLSPTLSFHDVYSLTDPDLLAVIPRPAHALLTIIPMTPTWNTARLAEDDPKQTYSQFGPNEQVLWFKQTIREGCGSIGTLHCILSSTARDQVVPGSDLERLWNQAIPLGVEDRAELLNQSDELFEAHQAAAKLGDTAPPEPGSPDHKGQHFVAFVKGNDGHLWELEGVRKGPIDRGLLAEDEDVLSPRAIELGLGRLIELEKAAGGDLRFSCTALAPSLD